MKQNPWQEIALKYIERGFYPVPLQLKSSALTRAGLLDQRITAENVGEYFDARTAGISLLLGATDNGHLGLMDVDLDSQEARALAPRLLPATEMISGRASNPASHYFYRAA